MSEINLNELDLNDLYLFAQVINAQNFTVASRQLNIPKATISRRIAKLEKTLGVTLIQRNTRQFEMTNMGQQLYQYCVELMEQTHKIQEFINGQDELTGSIKFSCPREMLDYHFTPFLLEFMQHYPKIDLQIDNTNQAVDLVADRFDFAIRGRPFPIPDSEIVTRPFFQAKQQIVASPKLVKQPVTELSELLNYPSLSWSNRHCWSFRHQTLGRQSINHKPKLINDNFFYLQKAAIAGLGIVVLPETLTAKPIANGELIAVVDEQQWQLDTYVVHAAYTSRKALQPSARLLLDFLSQKFGKN